MDKICLVAMRKKTVRPARPDEEGSGTCHPGRNVGPAPAGALHATALRMPDDARRAYHSRSNKKEFAAEKVSLTLTPEQMDTLRTDPYLVSFLRREFDDAAAGGTFRGEPIIIKLAWEPPGSVRLLRPEDLLQMMKISKGCLAEIVRKGLLKSYKIGRLRRFRLDDVLSYLEANQDYPGVEPQDAVEFPNRACTLSRGEEV